MRNGQSETLLNVILRREINSNVRLAAFRGLEKLKHRDDLERIVKSDQVPYRVKRMAAEALYRSSSISAETASLLLHFFDAQRNRERAPILIRRAFFNYKLDHNEEALKLLDHAFACGKKSAWALGVYGHCLQRLYKIDEEFCDSIGVTLSTNLTVFVRDFEVRHLSVFRARPFCEF